MPNNTSVEKDSKKLSRREFIKTASIAVGAAGVLAGTGTLPVHAAGKSKKLSLSIG